LGNCRNNSRSKYDSKRFLIFYPEDLDLFFEKITGRYI
jgi:hypothetical protein